jgi:hypothetical protein
MKSSIRFISVFVATLVGVLLGANLFLPMLSTSATAQNSFEVFYASLSGEEVVPKVETTAVGGAGAILRGNKLRVSGTFANLTGSLRDYAVDPPVPPNPNITSAVHIHRGARDQNGPFQYALKVVVNADRRSGSYSGEYDLTAEQLQALRGGQLYIDLHTASNRAGEIRGVFKPL